MNAAIRRLMDEPADDQRIEDHDREQRAEMYWRLLILWAEATHRGTLVTAA
ncbi:hypothetical protein [Streptomyces niveus]|uniref:hypothetical protein n=1 Tax=Streptomyces niveus TaxID=193462 RepID=UPI0036CDD048